MSKYPPISRRQLIRHAAGAAAVLPFVSAVRSALAASGAKRPLIMLRSGWQTVNIGDITHTPGVLAVLRKFIPEARVIAWLSAMDRGVDVMLKKEFPDVELTDDGKVAVSRFDEVDLMLHGSGPSVVAATSLDKWRQATKKPFGTFGVTVGSVNDWLRDLLNDAAFVFTRETASLDVLRKAGVTKPTLDFAPDGTFYFPIRDDEKGLAYLKASGLEERKFICAIPRLRYTPYHKIRAHGANWTPEHIKMVEETNDKYKEQDHAKIREAMIRWVRETGMKILVCPEMTYQLDIEDELLIDPLPADVKKQVVKRDVYWLPDEAASVYRRAHTVISAECHSPIIAAANGTPAFYIRQPTDTIKGQMYYDLGFNDWVFEVDDVTGKDIADQLMKVHADYPAALAKLGRAMGKVTEQYEKTTAVVKSHLGEAQ
ncbi:MAG: polysaccharide pyruvyl transferase family protein [Planctomycetes bacterium]|nr:polysaccharide pyruvyl transferase family protein [Planctomycetota bacterium]